jgi:hypothetical protein
MKKSVKKRADRAKKQIRKHVKAIEGTIEGIGSGRGRSKTKMAVVAGAAVAGAAGVAAAVRYARRGADGAVKLHIRAGDEGWDLTADGSEKPAQTFDTKKDAIDAGREAAAKAAPSDLVIHRRDGSVQRSHAYRGD